MKNLELQLKTKNREFFLLFSISLIIFFSGCNKEKTWSGYVYPNSLITRLPAGRPVTNYHLPFTNYHLPFTIYELPAYRQTD